MDKPSKLKMQLGSAPEHSPIPAPEDLSAKEVFAFYGLAAYQAQVFEQEVINIVAAVSFHETGLISETNIDSIFATASAQTLGALLRKVRQHLKVQEDIEPLLQEALVGRNSLAHGFFARHSEAFGSDVGRARMLTELRTLIGLFQRADSAITPLSHQLYAKLGMTQELVDHELAAMKKRMADDAI